ncbi:SufE family protein [Candidatus Portiera aleyrodidarum]|uniref:Fe-S cluster assembly protein SufE n=1 Tax=Candidatus Portiera aleyrodidarum MED (Bemisia tabaci) TaxID=1163752 RepID=A0AAU8RPV4_9GAMM|nr:SufE family protein [Candidatus Portiera aleyrodidarum]AFQ24105.1 SufE protein probably involved in Fe-S center assembly [Candidatus Portiera aleyrodidarum BT-B-HRs]AFS18868.1 Cysteine desulfuration protein sufE [Candidatus Portiera aleyrodidarum BT-QVLC]AFT80499.1 Sulfur acceptor protein SufE [Candidatus Portiera aleyrodidarum BT-QVLC]AFT80778.1 Sulfur acceptor protein SufE [Candidatus Portiera aleyrodidarum BT-B-HRs]AJF24081.1 Fe-S cluster assembly protein SufE [Candidatus Portiera aleyro
MSNIKAVQKKIIKELKFFDNWIDRYKYILDLGKKLPSMPAKWKKPKYLISGCQSNVWIHHKFIDNKVHFIATSDASIVLGLIAIILRIYNYRNPREILSTPLDIEMFVDLEQHLSMTRHNGLKVMLSHIYYIASIYIRT